MGTGHKSYKHVTFDFNKYVSSSIETQPGLGTMSKLLNSTTLAVNNVWLTTVKIVQL